MRFHPVADLFPLMSDDEAAALRADIAANGLREAIWTHEGQIVDGRNRYLACESVDVMPDYRPYLGDPKDLAGFVVSLNLKRRHLNESQRAMVAQKIANLSLGDNQFGGQAEGVQICTSVTQTEAAELLNVSKRSIASARKVVTMGVPELARMVEAGEIPVSRAATIASLSDAKQKRMIKSGRASGKKLVQKQRREALGNTERGHHGCLHCNPDLEYTPERVSAFLQKLMQRAADSALRHGTASMAPYFDSVVFEIEEARLGDLQLDNFGKVLAAIDRAGGVIEKSDLQRVVKISATEFNDLIMRMLMAKRIEGGQQGGKTAEARGARKTLFKRCERKQPACDLSYELEEQQDVYHDSFAENWA